MLTILLGKDGHEVMRLDTAPDAPNVKMPNGVYEFDHKEENAQYYRMHAEFGEKYLHPDRVAADKASAAKKDIPESKPFGFGAKKKEPEVVEK